jgi:hypothetical protein
VREDPDREGLLYAGTEFGLFVSFDDGARWQSLQLDLPVTPITGMKVHRKDLVLSTQGRSFWILDDLSPLHDVVDSGGEIAGSDAWLYPVRDAHRADMGGGSGLGGGVSPEPHPNGALIHYYLAETPDEPVTLEILDAAGERIRRFTSDSTAAAEADLPRLEDGAGGHRAVWDLTYPGPDITDDAVVWGYTGGVKAPPGVYRVRLSAGGTTMEREFRVLKDPRLTEVAQEDFDEQFRVATAVRDSVDRVYDALRTIETVQEQVDQALERAEQARASGDLGGLAARADSLEEKLTGVQTSLIQTKNESGQDPIRFPSKLDNQYLELYGFVTGPDGYISGGPEGRPTEGAYTRFEDLNQEWSELRQRLQTILRDDVEAFNRALERLGVPAVTVPDRPPTISMTPGR